MVTLYILGNAEIVDGISVDYITVTKEESLKMIAAGWRELPSELIDK